ncbi:uncharacterized protein LOC117295536 [Asterias rubens]|uniref:uncharacterized protein LOC117295536 n=1 Tax=Asterias rubens TaxID=7604 RepID=UPI00145595A8|nr:uncharacterized protein LOC117295536 [Asterias rubens]
MASQRWWISTMFVLVTTTGFRGQIPGTIGAYVPRISNALSEFQYCLEDCTCDDFSQSVTCANLGLPDIPYSSVRNNTRALYLHGNMIQPLTGQSIRRFRQLRLLDISDNHVFFISDDAFENQGKLVKLSLKGNNMTVIPVGALSKLRALRELDLTHNRISFLSPMSFVNLTKLQNLSLGWNEIHLISGDAFIGMDLLRILSLESNFLDEMPIGSLRGCNRLEHFYGSNNNIGTFVNDSETLSQFSARSWFEPSEPTRLLTLDLSHNVIDILSNSCYQGMTSLIYLDMTFNFIREFQLDLVVDLVSLDTLKLGNNPLSTLPPTLLLNMTNLMNVEFPNCELSEIPLGFFTNLTQIQTIDFTNNGLSNAEFMHAVHQSPYLRHLYLGRNSLTELPADGLTGFFNLQILDLSENSLTKLPNLEGLESLETLDVSDNFISRIGPHAFRDTRIVHLDFARNEIQKVFESTFNEIPDLEVVKVKGNPWVCDECGLQWTMDNPKYSRLISRHILCAWPTGWKNIKFLEQVLYYNWRLPECTSRPNRQSVCNLIAAWLAILAAVVVIFWAAVFHRARRRFRTRKPRQRFLLFRNPNDTNAGSTCTTGHSNVRFKALDSETESLEDDETTFSHLNPTVLCISATHQNYTMVTKWTGHISCPLFGTFFTLVALTALSRLATCRPVCPLFCKCNLGMFLINCTNQGIIGIPESDSDDSFSWATVFVFERNSIAKIGRTAFDSLPGLVELSLAFNGLQSIENGSFLGLQELEHLDLRGNHLVGIPAALGDLPNLRELSLAQNSLWNLDDEAFKGMGSLEKLYLDNNNIHVNGTPFKGLTSLSVLTMTSNALTEDPVGWFFSPMHELDLSDNQLSLTTEIWTWFNNSQDTPVPLRFLILRSNHIESIERGTFRQLSFLQELDIGMNQISFVDGEGLHDLWNLDYFAINDNWLESLHEETFLKTTYLEVLQLENNHLQSLPLGLFGKTERLASLNVANNRLKNIHAITQGQLPSLANLNLNYNLISKIQDDGFSQSTMLSRLMLAGNKLTTVPNIAGQLYLDTLDLGMNSIRSVPKGAFDGTGLRFILLNDNFLETLDAELFMDLYDLQLLNIRGNSWWCDCRLEWIQRLRTLTDPPIWADEIIQLGLICQNPPVYDSQDFMYEDVLLNGCPAKLDSLAVLGVLSVWFGLVGIFVTRMWVKKFSEVRKFKKVGKRNFRYSIRKTRKRRNGVMNNHYSLHTFGRSDSYTLILQNKDNDDQDGPNNNDGHDEWDEVARVTTV